MGGKIHGRLCVLPQKRCKTKFLRLTCPGAYSVHHTQLSITVLLGNLIPSTPRHTLSHTDVCFNVCIVTLLKPPPTPLQRDVIYERPLSIGFSLVPRPTSQLADGLHHCYASWCPVQYSVLLRRNVVATNQI